MKEWYYEEYDDQTSDNFDHVGVAGEEPVPIIDLLEQVSEYRRIYGHDVTIYVYNSQLCPA